MAAEEEAAEGCNALSLGGRAPCDHHGITRNISGQSVSIKLLCPHKSRTLPSGTRAMQVWSTAGTASCQCRWGSQAGRCFPEVWTGRGGGRVWPWEGSGKAPKKSVLTADWRILRPHRRQGLHAPHARNLLLVHTPVPCTPCIPSPCTHLSQCRDHLAHVVLLHAHSLGTVMGRQHAGVGI